MIILPRRQIVGSILILLILSFICMFIYNEFKDRKEERQTRLVIEKDNSGLNFYYQDSSKGNYYLYNLNQVTVDYGNHSLELNKALEAKQITINQVISLIGDNVVSYENGASTKIYNQDLSLLQCQTVNGSQDYYFGPSNMQYAEGFCKKSPYICSFVRTYLVLDISDSNNKEYSYLTLKEFQSEEVTTIKVEKKLVSDIEEDQYYEFRFGSLKESNRTDIKSLFESHLLLSISFTEKEGLEQVNEEVCRY